MNTEIIKQALAEGRDNFLRKETGIEREVLPIIADKIKLPHIIVIAGLRRVGKSTLLRQIAKKFFDDSKFLYFNFEDERLAAVQAKDFNLLLEANIELFGKQKALFFDEIQNIEGFETFVRRLYDYGYKIFLTGSNSRLLSSELATKLTGRYVLINLYPFSFREFLKLHNASFSETDFYITEKRVQIKKFFERYLVEGGMPEFLIYKDYEILTRIFQDIVIKDIAARFGITTIKELNRLYTYLLTNFAREFSYNRLKKYFGFGSVNTVKAYIDYARQSFLFYIVEKFSYSQKSQIVSNKKLYVVDNGFIHYIGLIHHKDRGRLLENEIFNHLSRLGKVNFFRHKNECDFILTKGDNKLPIQVTYELNEQNRQREIAGLVEAMDFVSAKTGLIITFDQADEIKLKDRVIKILPAYRFLLEENFLTQIP